MTIYPLSEGQFTVDATKVFVPFDEQYQTLRDRSVGSLLVEIQPFVVLTLSDVILLDAGLGYTIDGTLQIYQRLQSVGLQPEQVTKVFLSHLHKDHCGGIAYQDAFHVWQPAFPKATYYVQQAELAYSASLSSASYPASLIEWLASYDALVLLQGNTTIDNTIHCSLSGGHSPYHQVISIVQGGRTIFYGGDEAPQLQQMKHRFIAKYDKDGKRAMELRAQWWKTAAAEHWTFLFYHDVKNAVYQL